MRFRRRGWLCRATGALGLPAPCHVRSRVSLHVARVCWAQIAISSHRPTQRLCTVFPFGASRWLVDTLLSDQEACPMPPALVHAHLRTCSMRGRGGESLGQYSFACCACYAAANGKRRDAMCAAALDGALLTHMRLSRCHVSPDAPALPTGRRLVGNTDCIS